MTFRWLLWPTDMPTLDSTVQSPSSRYKTETPVAYENEPTRLDTLYMLLNLPAEQLSTVFSFCDPRSLVALSLVSPYLRAAVQSNAMLYKAAFEEVFFAQTKERSAEYKPTIEQQLTFVASLGDKVDVEAAIEELRAENDLESILPPFSDHYEVHSNALLAPETQLDNSLCNFTNPATLDGDTITWLVTEENWITVYALSLRDGILRVKGRRSLDQKTEAGGTAVNNTERQVQMVRSLLGVQSMTSDTEIYQEELWLKKVNATVLNDAEACDSGSRHAISWIMLPIGYSLPPIGVQRLQIQVNSRYSYCRLDSETHSAWFLLDWERAKSFLLFQTKLMSDQIALHVCQYTGCVYFTSRSSLRVVKLFPRVSNRQVAWYHVAQTNNLPKSYLSDKYGVVVKEGSERTYLKHKGSILLVGRHEGKTQCWKYSRPFLTKLDQFVRRHFVSWKNQCEDCQEWKRWKRDLSGYFYPIKKRRRD